MNFGMLWFDNNPKTTLASKVIRAMKYYTKKYGRVPNLCFVHPDMLQDPDDKKKQLPLFDENSGGIQVKPGQPWVLPILPGHLWIGIEERGNGNKEERL